MSHATVVQYRTRPDAAERNQQLIEAVFEELRDLQPAGLRYAAFRLEDGVGFLHVAISDINEDPFAQSRAFRRFQEGSAERLVGTPDVKVMTVVGSYGGYQRERVDDMKISNIASRDEWLAARLDLLADEKAASRQLAGLAERRRALPAVEIEKDYAFEGPDGNVGLVDLFEGRSQLIVYHFMWLHDIDDGCPSCSFAVDNMPDPIHLNEAADTTLALVSRAPYPRLIQFKTRMGWQLPWYSSHGSDFNYDFHVSNDESMAPIEYNYKDKATLQREGLEYVAANGADGQGISVFVRDDARVFHTYSAYGIGADVMLSTYRFLDLTPLGRQRYINEWPWHDTYALPGGGHEHHH